MPGRLWLDGRGRCRSRRYFAMARGARGAEGGPLRAGIAQAGAPALEMTKWFDTNYHYLVPELHAGPALRAAPRPNRTDAAAARRRAGDAHPAGAARPGDASCCCRRATSGRPLDAARRAAAGLRRGPARARRRRRSVGADRRAVPGRSTSTGAELRRLRRRLGAAARRAHGSEALLATYFAGSREQAGDGARRCRSPSAAPRPGARAGPARQRVLARVPPDLVLSLGVVDGRNVWRTDLRRGLAIAAIGAAEARRRSACSIAPSCSLLHVARRPATGDGTRPRRTAAWLAFAHQKLAELVAPGRGRWTQAAQRGRRAAGRGTSRRSRARRVIARMHNDPAVARAHRRDHAATGRRDAPVSASARQAQQAALAPAAVPDHHHRLLPADARGPARPRRRSARGRARRGRLRGVPAAARPQTPSAGRRRSASTCWCTASSSATTWSSISASSSPGSPSPSNGWVQSYGSRCVKPPIIYGDVVAARRR